MKDDRRKMLVFFFDETFNLFANYKAAINELLKIDDVTRKKKFRISKQNNQGRAQNLNTC